MTILLSILLSISDAVLYGIVYERKGLLKKSLFYEVTYKGRVYVPFYRLFQWSLDLIAFGLAYKYCGLDATLLMLASFYFMFKEFNYYLLLRQWRLLLNFERDLVHVYWLDRPWFSGSFFFIGGFTVKKFIISYIISWLFLIAGVIV